MLLLFLGVIRNDRNDSYEMKCIVRLKSGHIYFYRETPALRRGSGG